VDPVPETETVKEVSDAFCSTVFPRSKQYALRGLTAPPEKCACCRGSLTTHEGTAP